MNGSELSQALSQVFSNLIQRTAMVNLSYPIHHYAVNFRLIVHHFSQCFIYELWCRWNIGRIS